MKDSDDDVTTHLVLQRPNRILLEDIPHVREENVAFIMKSGGFAAMSDYQNG